MIAIIDYGVGNLFSLKSSLNSLGIDNIVTKDANEIVAEGSKQRICIGGYVSSHATGQTNLFFLRKKSEPDKPFYAIEMRSNTVNQIHGFGNRWLGCNPEAIPTVIRWLRKNKIKCTDHILTCTATGYGGNATHCPMPVVD